MLNIEFAGRSLCLDGREGADLVAHQMAQGSYEAPLPMLLMAVLSRVGGLFLDIGANNGLYSILAAKTRDDIKVVAFEPYRPVAEVLQQNIQANGIQDRVTIMHVALSDRSGSVALYLPDPAHGLLETSASLEASFKPFNEAINVERDTLDNVNINERVSCMKIDVEGHEAECIYGGLKIIDRDRPFIFAEMLPVATRKFAELASTLKSRGYLLFRLRVHYVVGCEDIRFDPESWNYAFVPHESFAVFQESCKFHKLEILKFYSNEF